MEKIAVETKRGTLLDGVLFSCDNADTVLIGITGIHGNFYTNPFYYNIGYTLIDNGIDFIYAQTNDALGVIRTQNVKTGKEEIIGSWNEDFNHTDEDIEAYLNFAEKKGYEHIILAGHSLGANKVIYYLSHNYNPRIEHFLFLSPANISYLTETVSDRDRNIIKDYMSMGKENEIIPFYLFGWVKCTAKTAYDWVFNNILNNVHVEEDGDFSQIEKIRHTGAMLIGTYDGFTYGDPCRFLENINNHMQTKNENKLIFIELTGHTYEQKEDELANEILGLIKHWINE